MPPPRQVGTATGSPGAGTALGGGQGWHCHARDSVLSLGVAVARQGMWGRVLDVGPAVPWGWGWHSLYSCGVAMCHPWGCPCPGQGAVPCTVLPPPKVPSSEPHIPGAGQDRAQPLSTQLRPHPLCPLQATGAQGVERGPRAHLEAV